MISSEKKICIWAISKGGLKIGLKLLQSFSDCSFYISKNISDSYIKNIENNIENSSITNNIFIFDNLKKMFQKKFRCFDAHICIFSTGITVRIAASSLESKLTDPAIVVVDDCAFHVISLLSGHIGGANELTQEVAVILDSSPVITTATDINKRPAIDIIAKQNRLFIENPALIKKVNMVFLEGKTIKLIDPFNIVKPHIKKEYRFSTNSERAINHLLSDKKKDIESNEESISQVEIYCSDVVSRETLYNDNNIVNQRLILRPQSLHVGIGCNRGTTKSELMELLLTVFNEYSLSINSIASIATISIKNDEAGILELAQEFKKKLKFYDKEELKSVKNIQNSSDTVEKYIGVKSVCEAAAILAAQNGELIIPKIKKGNATIAVARISMKKIV